MAQFDVHHNTGRLKGPVPYVLTVQSQHFDASEMRVVIPLIDIEAFGVREARLNPLFRIGDRDVVLDPLQMAAIPTARLGEHVGSIADRGNDVIGAVDLLISRAHG